MLTDASVKAKKKYLFIGHSHLNCIFDAYNSQRLSADMDARFIQLLDKQFQPLFLQNPSLTGLNQNLKAMIQVWLDTIKQACSPMVFMSMMGNEHSILGLVRHPQPFDFFLPESPEAPFDEGAAIIPYQAIRAKIQEMSSPSFFLAAELAKLFPFPVCWLEPPPPIGNETYIRSYPGVFKAAVPRYGITPASTRYKLWRLQADIARKWCSDNGWEYIAVADEARDAQGFLAQEAWTNKDPTHGNIWYGKLLLEKILSNEGRVG